MESCIISHAVGLYNLHIHTLGISNALHLRQFYNKYHSSSLILQFYELLLYDEIIKKQREKIFQTSYPIFFNYV